MTRPVAWDFPLDLDAHSPLGSQIVRGITGAIQSGRLRAGDALPGTRSLAATLGIHRNTVADAYGELVAEGWLAQGDARGTFVAATLPTDSLPSLPKRRRGEHVGYDFCQSPEGTTGSQSGTSPQVLALGTATPDPRLLPSELLARAYRRALRIHGRSALSYGPSDGHPQLRAAVAKMLSEARGIPATADDLLMTRGSQMGLYLAARVLLKPGDTVVVEAFSYGAARETFGRAGATILPVQVDGDGMDVGELVRIAKSRRIRAVYVTPHHQFPTTVTLSATRRMALLQFAKASRAIIFEDDYDHDFHYESRPVLPLASHDSAGSVVYFGTLAKVLAPGLRSGFVYAPQQVLAAMAQERRLIDRQGDTAMEIALAELFEDGEVQRHVRKMRNVYRARRDLLVSLLKSKLGNVLSFQVPRGGMGLWARVGSKVSVEPWAKRCLTQNVSILTGKNFASDGKVHPFVRLGFSALSPNELEKAVGVLRKCV